MAPSIQDSRLVLLQCIAQMYEEKLCTDMKIVCGKEEFGVHRAIVCSRSSVFKQAYQSDAWIEGCSGVIVLGHEEGVAPIDAEPSSDPVAVRMMLDFIYLGDYEPGLSPYGEEHAQHTSSGNNPGPSSSNAAQLTSDGRDLPTSSTSDDELASMESGLLDLHAKLYSLADKYDIPSLLDKTCEKFERDASKLVWHDAAFARAITTAFTTAPESASQLRRLITSILFTRTAYLSDTVKLRIAQHPELAIALWQRSVTAIARGSGPRCSLCGTVTVKQCRTPGCNTWFAQCKCTAAGAECDGCKSGIPDALDEWDSFPHPTKKAKQKAFPADWDL